MWVQIKHSLIGRFRPSLRNGCVYVMRNYNVVRVFDELRPVNRRYKIFFNMLTSVKMVSPLVPAIPMHAFQFVPLATMASRCTGSRVLTDIAGCVTVVGDVKPYADGLVRVGLEMKSDFSNRFMVTLSGDSARSFITKFNLTDVPPPIVYVFSAMTVRQYLGSFIFSATCGTHVYMNLDNDYVASLATIYGGESPETSMLAPHITVQDSIGAALFDDRMTVAQITRTPWANEQLGHKFTIAGSIVSFSTKVGWFHFGCRGFQAFDLRGFRMRSCRI